jgi:hypothetical protein
VSQNDEFPPQPSQLSRHKPLRPIKNLVHLARVVAPKPHRIVSELPYFLASHGITLRDNETKLLSFRNKHRGRRAFIIGGGPSLRQTDVRRLKDEITIGCNAIFLMFEETGFLPTYYTVEDVLVAEDRAEEINAMRGTTKIFPRDLKYCLKPDEDTIYINFVRDYAPRPFSFSSDFARRVFWGGTVTYLNLQLAHYLGCREIYLIGIDHSYHGPSEKDTVEGTIITSRSSDTSHFHPDYFGPGYRWHDPKVERMEMAYRQAKSFFDTHGVAVYNASAETRLKVFPQVSYEALFGRR